MNSAIGHSTSCGIIPHSGKCYFVLYHPSLYWSYWDPMPQRLNGETCQHRLMSEPRDIHRYLLTDINREACSGYAKIKK